MELPKFQWWGLPLWGGKDKDKEIEDVSNESCYGYGFGESVKFPVKGATSSSSPSPRKKMKKKWNSREERKIDREHDLVMVPTDGVCLSGSESDDSDWSIGWLEPHGPDFLTDDETDDSFAVLVPCYKRGPIDGANAQLLMNAIKGLGNHHFNGQNFTEQWLSSLHNF